MKKVTASVVLFNTPHFLISRVINCIVQSNVCDKLFIIDNSPEPIKFNFKIYKFIEYIRSENNGYGAGHNLALKKAANFSDFHFVLNPDILFEKSVLSKMIKAVDDDLDIGLMMPKIVYPNGELQYLCKLIPSPKDLFLRRFPIPFLREYVKRSNERYELRFTGYKSIMDVPTLSGCFMLLRMSAINHVGMFDERFFMYAEDVDLSRRMHAAYKTIFYPYVTVIHDHAKDSFKNTKMLLIHMISIIRYFNKWGWLFDQDRKKLNNQFFTRINRD